MVGRQVSWWAGRCHGGPADFNFGVTAGCTDIKCGHVTYLTLSRQAGTGWVCNCGLMSQEYKMYLCRRQGQNEGRHTHTCGDKVATRTGSEGED